MLDKSVVDTPHRPTTTSTTIDDDDDVDGHNDNDATISCVIAVMTSVISFSAGSCVEPSYVTY